MTKVCVPHVWKSYQGLRESFEYCEKCDIKRDDYEKNLSGEFEQMLLPQWGEDEGLPAKKTKTCIDQIKGKFVTVKHTGDPGDIKF